MSAIFRFPRLWIVLRANGSIRFKISRLAPYALLISALGSTPTLAQTVTYGDTMRSLAKACDAAIEKHCVGYLPGEGLGDCLAKHGSSVSSACMSQMKSTIAVLLEREANQAAAVEICQPDIRRFCRDYKPGRGHMLTCIKRVDIRPKISKKCLQAVAAAGWM